MNFPQLASTTVTDPEITNPQVVAQHDFGQLLHHDGIQVVPTSNVRGINSHFALGHTSSVGDFLPLGCSILSDSESH